MCCLAELANQTIIVNCHLWFCTCVTLFRPQFTCVTSDPPELFMEYHKYVAFGSHVCFLHLC